MSNDKTLADVQPGGRVRLGDQADAASAHDLETIERVAMAMQASENKQSGWTWTDCSSIEVEGWMDLARAAVAALSAQPSPGGQGDARLLADVDERIETAKALGYEDDIGVGIGLLQCVRAALSARQPVGEPAAWITQDALEAFAKHRAGNADAATNSFAYAMTGNGFVPLYRYPPAQALDDRFPGGFADAIAYVNQIEELAEGLHTKVFGHESDGEAGATTVLQMVGYELAEKPAQAVDLGKLHDLARSWIVEAGGTAADTKHACADELLALIDSQAVGNG